MMSNSSGKLDQFKPKVKISKEFLFLILISILVMVYFAFNEEEYKLDYYRAQLVEKENKLSTLQKKKKEIDDKIRFLQSDQGVESLAREELKLVLPGEILIIPKKKN